LWRICKVAVAALRIALLEPANLHAMLRPPAR
jgi:hypothetical protein